MAAVDAPHFWQLDYIGDFTLYQHPPCMFVLWWMGHAVNAVWDPIRDLIDQVCGGGGDGGGGGEKKEEGDQEPQEGEGEGEPAEEEGEPAPEEGEEG